MRFDTVDPKVKVPKYGTAKQWDNRTKKMAHRRKERSFDATQKICPRMERSLVFIRNKEAQAIKEEQSHYIESNRSHSRMKDKEAVPESRTYTQHSNSSLIKNDSLDLKQIENQSFLSANKT